PVDRLIAEGELPTPPGGCGSHYVATPPEAYSLFYRHFSNEVLWFLQHGLAWPKGMCASERFEAWSKGYLKVNEAFADAAVNELGGGRVRGVLFHDYHFYVDPRGVRS